MKKGDANTAHFHKFASQRRKRNALLGLNINGFWEENPDAVKEEAVRYFSNSFSSIDNVNIRFPIQPTKTISDSDRSWIEREFSMEEIKDAVWECGVSPIMRKNYE